MNDNENKIDYLDGMRINTNEDYELEYWSKKYNISGGLLLKAVSEVGPMVKDVESWLNNLK